VVPRAGDICIDVALPHNSEAGVFFQFLDIYIDVAFHEIRKLKLFSSSFWIFA
jgi:hypothetical protein